MPEIVRYQALYLEVFWGILHESDNQFIRCRFTDSKMIF